MGLDPASAALYALIAISLVAAGWAISSPLTVAERGSVLAAIVAVLAAIGWRIRRGRDKVEP